MRRTDTCLAVKRSVFVVRSVTSTEPHSPYEWVKDAGDSTPARTSKSTPTRTPSPLDVPRWQAHREAKRRMRDARADDLVAVSDLLVQSRCTGTPFGQLTYGADRAASHTRKFPTRLGQLQPLHRHAGSPGRSPGPWAPPVMRNRTPDSGVCRGACPQGQLSDMFAEATPHAPSTSSRPAEPHRARTLTATPCG